MDGALVAGEELLAEADVFLDLFQVRLAGAPAGVARHAYPLRMPQVGLRKGNAPKQI